MTMTSKFLPLAFALLAGAAAAHDEHDAGKQITVTGTVVDTGCYVTHASKGPDHAACALACAKKGAPLAILDSAGKLYLPIAADHANQNDKLIPFIEKKVKVTGSLMVKGGLTGIALKSVEGAE